MRIPTVAVSARLSTAVRPVTVVWRRLADDLPASVTTASGFGLLLLAVAGGPIDARVLGEDDFASILQVKTSFAQVSNDLARSLRSPDISSTESDCIRSALQELVQLSGELSSYEYLITIESQLGEFGDDNAMRGILRFAVDHAVSILEGEHRRLEQLSDRCSRSSVSMDKIQLVTQFIDKTTTILRSIRPRL